MANSSVRLKYTVNNTIKPLIINRLYSFPATSATWHHVFKKYQIQSKSDFKKTDLVIEMFLISLVILLLSAQYTSKIGFLKLYLISICFVLPHAYYRYQPYLVVDKLTIVVQIYSVFFFQSWVRCIVYGILHGDC